MIKYLLLIFISLKFSLACNLCAIMSPHTLVNLELINNEQKIDKIIVKLKITKEFTNTLIDMYDINSNQKLDDFELHTVKNVLEDYIKVRNYLAHISYEGLVNKEKSIKVNGENLKAYLINDIIHFSYEIPLNLNVTEGNILYIKIEDKEEYFKMYMSNEIKFTKFENLETLVGEQIAFFYFGIKANEKDLEDEYNKEQLQLRNEQKEKEVIKEEIEPTSIDEKIEKETIYISYLKEFSQKVKDYLLRVKDGDNIALFTLLLVSFVYGIVHAMGPGHGKSLAFSYFLSNKTSYLKAFAISQASAFVHIVGALILVIISIFIIDSVLNSFVEDSVAILTKVSALMIISLASYLLYNKLKNKDCACNTCCSSHQQNSSIKWSAKEQNSIQKLKPNFMKKDLYFVITSGLIPCPGTVILFIYAFILKTYFAVLLAAIFISLGMGVVIFASSFLGLSLNKLSQKSHKLTSFLEILAPIIMIVLGILLYLGSDFI